MPYKNGALGQRRKKTKVFSDDSPYQFLQILKGESFYCVCIILENQMYQYDTHLINRIGRVGQIGTILREWGQMKPHKAAQNASSPSPE
ncbi:hypothetical protein AGMMS50267_01860 [Spirochaetia bacterium]|nr:hypothetical protein AGMMS50267_01860 [Spirochaetia bacterium]